MAVLSNLCFFHRTRLRGRGDHKGVIGPSFILIGPAFFNTPRDDSKTSLQVQHSHKSYKSTEIDAQQTQQHQLKQNYPIIKSHLVQATGTNTSQFLKKLFTQTIINKLLQASLTRPSNFEIKISHDNDNDDDNQY